MDNELLKALNDLFDEKLSPIKDDIASIKHDVMNLQNDVKNVKEDIKSIKTQQEESMSILRALEHSAEINKSEHDKISNDIAKLSGTVENMRKDLCAVEVVTARNLENIAQLKLVK